MREGREGGGGVCDWWVERREKARGREGEGMKRERGRSWAGRKQEEGGRR